MAYVYEHWRPDKNVCFYVGKGSGRRVALIKRGTRYHVNIVKKLTLAGMSVDVRIIADGLSDDDAFDLEKARIAYWRECGVRLANLSSGGKGGLSGCKRSAESRAKQSATTKGRIRTEAQKAKSTAWIRSPEGKAMTSATHTGRKRPKETGPRISAGVKKSWTDPAIRESRITAMKEKLATPEVRAKMRRSKTPQHRAKTSAATKRQWENPVFRKLVSDTMKRTNAARRIETCAG